MAKNLPPSPGIEPQFSCATRSLVTIRSWYYSYKSRHRVCLHSTLDKCRSFILHNLRTNQCTAVLTTDCFTSQIDLIHFVLVFAPVVQKPLSMSLLVSMYFRICRARSETSVADIRRGNGPGANLNSRTTSNKCLFSQLLYLFNDTVSICGC
jgi:hypothetical protein